MATQIEFQDLLSTLPSCRRFDLMGKRDDVSYTDEQKPAFVAPSLRPRTDVNNPSQPRVVIISAAGAVGKSTLAEELTRERDAPLWDLSRAKTVGQGSLAGMISQAYGVGLSPEVTRAVIAGELFFVIDALDEARVKVTESAFLDFLQDIADLGGQCAGVGFILLGRTQIAETAWLALEDSVPTSILTIQPFSREQAETYIERRIRTLDEAAAESMDQNQQPFRAARDTLLDGLSKAVMGVDASEASRVEAEAFIGYAPVLDALAFRMSRETNWVNLQALASESSKRADRAEGPLRPAALLREVVLGVLNREHEQKLGKNLRPVLEPTAQGLGWSEWEEMYAPHEQCARLITRVLSVPFSGPTASFPPALRGEYEERLAEFAAEHPFLVEGSRFASVVFEAYVFANALTDEALRPYRSSVEQRMASPGYLPSRLFAEFYLLSAPRRGELPFVTAEHVGLMYDSILAGETDDVQIDFSLEADDRDEPHESAGTLAADAEGEFAFIPVEQPEEQRRLLFATFLKPESTVSFTHSIKNLMVTVPTSFVALGGGGDEFAIGPRVRVECARLAIHARTLVVGGRTSGSKEDDAAVIQAKSCTSTVTQPPVVHGELRVSWPGAEAYPWVEHYVSGEGPYASEREMNEAYRRFRRIVMTFRSHSKGGLARYRGKIEHRRVLQGSLGERLLERLKADRILKLVGSRYHWSPDDAARHVGISYQQLRDGETSPTLTDYLKGFLKEGA
jgi:hypothetical protein